MLIFHGQFGVEYHTNSSRAGVIIMGIVIVLLLISFEVYINLKIKNEIKKIGMSVMLAEFYIDFFNNVMIVIIDVGMLLIAHFIISKESFSYEFLDFAVSLFFFISLLAICIQRDHMFSKSLKSNITEKDEKYVFFTKSVSEVIITELAFDTIFVILCLGTVKF